MCDEVEPEVYGISYVGAVALGERRQVYARSRYVDALARTEFASVLRCCVYLVSVDAVDEEVQLAVVD